MTRVELHDANYADYEKLHTEMQAEGFSRTVVADSGIKYKLPTAEYYRISNLSVQEIVASAQRAATTTGKKFEIISSEITGWYSINLEKAV